MEGILNSAVLPIHLTDFLLGHIDVHIPTRTHSCPSLLEQLSSSIAQLRPKIKRAGQVDSQGSMGSNTADGKEMGQSFKDSIRDFLVLDYHKK